MYINDQLGINIKKLNDVGLIECKLLIIFKYYSNINIMLIVDMNANYK